MQKGSNEIKRDHFNIQRFNFHRFSILLDDVA